MKILIIGGSIFVGRTIVECAVKQGSDVTVFNRGKSSEDFTSTTTIHGDRTNNKDLEKLKKYGPWDLIIDSCVYEPEQAKLSGEILKNSTTRYLLISSLNAFKQWGEEEISTSSQLYTSSDPYTEENSYGWKKASCERSLAAALGPQLSVIYPSVIIGPYENLGRLPTWLYQMNQGAETLIPEEDHRIITPIDVRDLSHFILSRNKDEGASRYVVAGCPHGLTLYQWLHLMHQSMRCQGKLLSETKEKLLAHNIIPWSEFPLWGPLGIGVDALWKTNISGSIQAGLKFTHPLVTINDTWAWMKSIKAHEKLENIPHFEGHYYPVTKINSIIHEKKISK